jgi:hypothetical protein
MRRDLEVPTCNIISDGLVFGIYSMAERPLITIGFSSHRLEVLPAVQEEMERHDALVLEEAPEPSFAAVLSGELEAAAYLEDIDPGFPQFSRAELDLAREFHRAGKAVLQVEPYLSRLLQIHELLAGGRRREEVEAQPDLREVYAAESLAGGALLTFYARAHTAPFPRVVAAVKEFARADAARFLLRDDLRAQALAPMAAAFPRLLVEAGYIHLALVKALRRQLGGTVRLRPVWFMAANSRPALGRPRPLGPGDLLTLRHIFKTPLSPDGEDLLAARSLIYIQLLEKGELAPGLDPAPHLTNEIQAYHLTAGLTWEDCAALYPRVRAATPETARREVRRYLGKRST